MLDKEWHLSPIPLSRLLEMQQVQQDFETNLAEGE